MTYFESDYGLDKPTTYFFIGGDHYYENWHGYIKNVKFFYDTAINEGAMACLSDENCASCSNIGVCTQCITGHKLVNNRCVCDTIEGCLYCPNKDVCNECEKNKIINSIVTPNQCVVACPANTREILNRCHDNLKFIEILGSTARLYN